MPLKGEAEEICGYVLMFTDETEEYQKSEKVEELFTKLKTVMRCSDSLLWEYDVKTDKMNIDLDLRVLGNKSRLRANNLTTKNDFMRSYIRKIGKGCLYKALKRLLRVRSVNTVFNTDGF